MIAALPETTVRKIKSGQVVSDVRSVVKELIENSLDAGATCVRILIGDNCGIDSVIVADNGCGISEANRVLCAQEHATSKLPDYDGLSSVSTFGFRGEALFCMRQCSKCVTILTRSSTDSSPVEVFLTPPRDKSASNSSNCDGYDCHLEIIKDVPSLKKSGALDRFTTGTAVRVTQLWAHHPVRLEYLRGSVAQQPAKEIKKLVDLVECYAIAKPEVRFELTFSEKSKAHPFRCGPCKDIGTAIESIYGPLLFDELQHVHFKNADETVCIDGYLPAKAGQHMITMRKVNDRMFTYLNGRPVEMSRITRYITAICRKWLCPTRKAYPFICLHVSLPYGTYDVNVSPDKKKVFLQDEEMLMNCVKEITDELYPVRVTPVEEEDGVDDSVDSSSSSPLSGVLSQRLKEVASVGVSQVSIGGQRLLTYSDDGLQDDLCGTPDPISRIAPDVNDMDVSQPRDVLKKDGNIITGMKRPSSPSSASSTPPKVLNSGSNSGSPVPPSPAKLVAESGFRDRLYGRDSVFVAANARLHSVVQPAQDLTLPVMSLEAVISSLSDAFKEWTNDNLMVVSDYSTKKQLTSPTFGHSLSVIGVCQAPAATTWCFIVKEALTVEQWNLWFLPSHRAEECVTKKLKPASDDSVSSSKPSLQRGEQLLASLSKEHQTHCLHKKPLFIPFCTINLRKQTSHFC